jgi:cysteine rich repeat protein
MYRPILGVAVALALFPLAALAQSAAPKSPPTPPAATAPSTEASEARAKVRTACAADIQKLCPNIEKGKGGLRNCLQANEKQLTDACKAARAERAAERAKIKG